MFYTGKGDSGKSVINNKKISKDDLFFDFLGSLDELNSFLGVIRTHLKSKSRQIKIGDIKVENIILEIQEKIFRMQAEVAMDKFKSQPKGFNRLNDGDILYMEELILTIDKKLPPLKNFIIPGENLFSAYLDYGRAVSRRTERIAVKFLKKKNKKNMLIFLNRLSSLLFALARYVNFKLNVKEVFPAYK